MMKEMLNGIVRTLSIAVILLQPALHANAQPQLSYSPLISSGLTAPVELKSAGDGSGRLFIAEQGGKIKIWKNGALLAKPFLDISDITGYSDYQGIWSIVFAPNYRQSRAFFVLYTGINGYTELVRYQASRTYPDTALPATRSVLLSYPGNGTGGPHFGDLQFGPDGYLYVTQSDGSSPTTTVTYAQNGRLPFGKMLRLNVNRANAPFYSIPPDNPFTSDPQVLDEIWYSGFRNAWRFSFDNRTGTMWLPDVGGNRSEELNVFELAQSGGFNFGWPCYESNLSYLTENCGPVNTYKFPAFTYPNDSAWGGSCIIGGYVYRGDAYPALKGFYVCSDFISSNAWLVRRTSNGTVTAQLQQPAPPGIVGYGTDEANELYAVSLAGAVYRVGATATSVQRSTETADAANTAPAGKGTHLYPTLIQNNLFHVALHETYHTLLVTDMHGRVVYRLNISGKSGTIPVNLPAVSRGTYTVQLLGNTTFRQAIYVQ